ncbi:BON domain-containing protein [Pyruvatibacter mobilis]|uniref:BON domain-containing protein n=1 Tax=Pyruvatibacter mobilis TaxID=1712261 RepID=UPI003BAC90C7
MAIKMALKSSSLLALAAAGSLALAACTPVGMAVGAGATAGIAAFQERPVGEALTDTEIKLGLTDRLLKSDDGLYSKVSSKVMEGRVMMTGLVQRDEERAAATRIAWTVPGVREVINEIEISETSSLETLPSDEWIDAKLSARLLTDFSISDINYATDVTNGSVYVLGIGQDEGEIDRVAAHARDISGVRRVVMHAITVNDPRRMAERPAGVPAEQPFERQPAGERQGHVLAEAQEREDILTGQPPLRTDMSAYDDAVAIETASTTPAYQPAYEPAYQPAPAYDTGAGGPRSLSPGASAIESRDLAPVR